MSFVLALSVHAGRVLAEVGFLLILIAGVWLAVSQTQAKLRSLRMLVAGIALAISGLLLIIATHWGHFG